jgi:Inner membrane protein CreD
MFRRILAISFIFVCTAIAWGILGSTIFARTYGVQPGLRDKVASSWGAQQEQSPPSLTYLVKVREKTTTVENGKSVEQIHEKDVETPLPLDSSRMDVSLDLEHRQKGLLWYSTYRVSFSGLYRFRNDTGRKQDVTLNWRYPAQKAIFDDLSISLDGKPYPVANQSGGASVAASMSPGATAVIRIGYRSQGLDTWSYNFGGDVSQVHDFSLRVKTNFRDIDFPENSLSATEKHEAGQGWLLTWTYNNLVAGYHIAVAMPAKLQPGPLAGQISYFAPVSLFFFFFLLFLVTTLREIELHPMNYFFLAAAFFAFHLLLAYLVDHVTIHTAFAVASVVSVALVVSYLRLVVGPRFALQEAGIAQFVFLVLFSYAFFFKGFTGLTVTIGAVVTLFVAMQMTGRIRWSERFSRRPEPQPTVR